MFMGPKGPIFALTTATSPYCGNTDYQRFNIVPAVTPLTLSLQETGPPIDIVTRLRSDKHIYTRIACYAEDANRTMCTLSLPMCKCASPHYFHLKNRSLYSSDNGLTKPFYLNNYFEAVYLGGNNTYCHIHDVQAGYPADTCIGVLLDSNGYSL